MVHVCTELGPVRCIPIREVSLILEGGTWLVVMQLPCVRERNEPDLVRWYFMCTRFVAELPQ